MEISRFSTHYIYYILYIVYTLYNIPNAYILKLLILLSMSNWWCLVIYINNSYTIYMDQFYKHTDSYTIHYIHTNRPSGQKK